jgi:hypothetical protein
MTEPILPAGGVLSRHEPKPGRELTARFEDGRIRHTGREGRGGDDAYTRDRLEPLACLVPPVPRHEMAFDLADLFRQALELRGQRQKRRPSKGWQVQPVVRVAEASGELDNLPWSLRGDHP